MEKFKQYETPKKGTFMVETGKYITTDEFMGWETTTKEATIIGETKDTYVTQVKDVKHGFWVDGKKGEIGKVEQRKTKVYLGFHKTRLMKWNEKQ